MPSSFHNLIAALQPITGVIGVGGGVSVSMGCRVL
jgi:hypothetical protein